ncbi:hypothetical protein SAMN05444392_102177 [Seinonella peptonophila]|uniref:Uncharacterized protein n=1 Tax=Seinonella peptonophila TaxID=112248 RepID=A0A1M4V5I5_9BACL|nr:DUF6042 family protein [Seinonella peptonophila]SHE64143.1 hypothetical protein SAMN05444392_102177 [Seinonella peptonophila]
MLGFQTILNTGWDHDDIYVPSGFLRNAWNLCLPKGTLSILLSVMSYVLQGLSKEELLEQMRREEKELHLSPFTFHLKNDGADGEIIKRENEVRKLLERSGYEYPQNIESWLSLLVQVGILIEIRYKNRIFLDLVVEPYPVPEKILTFQDDELHFLLIHRESLKTHK